ncbi:MAG: hypothetical protein KatS3mg125_0523 [Lysobacterales bacterium]|jgi:hypothetical protein|nr:MAG: hypothetical protein KatS3mg125_0523 [Xanthomonadales bacterium]
MGEERPEPARARLFVLLASNRRPALHLALAVEALERWAPVERELGRHRGPALGGRGFYENRLVSCRCRFDDPARIDRVLKRIERDLAPRLDPDDCPLDLDPFLLVHGGCASTFARTAKVLALLARLDPLARLGFDRALDGEAVLEWR